MINLILFGPPGVGKGTQSQILIEHFNLAYLATGDILRTSIANQTPLGIEAAKYMDRGELVPDKIVIGMIERRMNMFSDKNGVILDGFPRTIPQAAALDGLLKGRNDSLTAVMALVVPHDVLVERLLNRGKTSGRTDDAKVETIENRIRIYHNKTEPLIRYYAEKDLYFAINGVGKIEEITHRLIENIESLVD
jgi:adenylate kinase